MPIPKQGERHRERWAKYKRERAAAKRRCQSRGSPFCDGYVHGAATDDICRECIRTAKQWEAR
jgi:hypothetical protein